MIAALDFIDEHRRAVAYDLLNLGMRLRDFPSPDLTYGDMLVIIQHAPRSSAIARAVDPERAEWSLSDYLLAQIADANAWLVWSKSKDAERNRNRPKPIPRPGLEPDEDVQHFGSEPVPLDELEDFLGWSAELAGVAPLANPPQPRDARGRFMRNP